MRLCFYMPFVIVGQVFIFEFRLECFFYRFDGIVFYRVA